ncbi:MAG: CvpA family protein [bacterium]|nr:CvpA family protein [bacterium]
MIDALIVIVLLAYAAFGYRRGFVGSVAELVGLLLGLAVAFLLSEPLGGVAAGFLRLPRGLLDLGAFLVIWSLIEFLIAFGWKKLSARVPDDLSEHPANRLTGIAPALLKGITLVMIVLLIVATAPIPASAKEPFTESRLGKVFLAVGTTFQQQVNGLFGEALRDTLAFKTVKTDSTETAELGFTDTSAPECLADARALFDRANEERAERGLGRLTWDDSLRLVGLRHSRDMLARGYFSHVNPDGEDPFDRMAQADIRYAVAGENLAFAPNVDIAHTGLMNSPGHRANILKSDFTRLGIGCADAGIRGKMFSQEFTG